MKSGDDVLFVQIWRAFLSPVSGRCRCIISVRSSTSCFSVGARHNILCNSLWSKLILFPFSSQLALYRTSKISLLSPTRNILYFLSIRENYVGVFFGIFFKPFIPPNLSLFCKSAISKLHLNFLQKIHHRSVSSSFFKTHLGQSIAVFSRSTTNLTSVHFLLKCDHI